MAIDIGGLVLKNILNDPEKSLEIWPRIKLAFFGAEYSSIYSAIAKYYNKYSKLPSFDDLDITVREGVIKNSLKALSLLEVPEDIDLEIAVEALINEYTQNEALIQLDKFVDNITLLDTEELKEELNNIVFYLEEKTHNSEQIVLMSDMTLIDDEELESRVPLGINNTFDANIGGLAPTELIMFGGHRGSGKSVLCTNLVGNQYLQGNSSIYFSIEMRGREVYMRQMAMLAKVPYNKIRKGECTSSELARIAKVMAGMYEDSSAALDKYYETGNFRLFEQQLAKESRLKKYNQIIFVDNQELTLADIDLNLQKFKAQFGDKLKVVIVDYVNQINIPDIYNWQQQINLSKGLKKLARKYNIIMVAPYQVDKDGEARFAKGILDAADVAAVLTGHNEYINFKSTKTRNIPPFEFNAPIDWESLHISGEDAVVQEEEPEESGDKKPYKRRKREGNDLEL